jgi:hypothetical protein
VAGLTRGSPPSVREPVIGRRVVQRCLAELGDLVDWGIVLLLVLIGGAIVAPVAAAVTSLWPSGATRWAARACLMMVLLAVVLLAVMWVEHRLTGGGYYDESGEFIERGDDSGVIIFMSAAVLAAGLVNLVGWIVANARTPGQCDRPRPSSTSGSRSWQ